ncbi:unnamed protein product [Mytilus coruscus]|uniref:Uncharacterized protein n=1 Tax=Mytilus coruscus TaxID=42192 RepID=A0A6J8BKJ6_MYTCO|nr:unnamed protein product [Mytilus coruscus]
MEIDNKDSTLLTEYLTDRNPFTNDKTLQNIEIGMVADIDVNADEAKTVGDKIVESLAGHLVSEISFKKKDQIVTLDAKRSSGSNISQQPQVDPQLMFQRLTAVGQESLNNTAELFEYELSSFPSSLFKANGLPKQEGKATLADAIWNMNDCHAQDLPETNIVQVIDGGSLLYRIPWIKANNPGAEINRIILENKWEACALVLCILCCDGFDTDWLKLNLAPQDKKAKLEDIVNEFGIIVKRQ